MPFKFPFPSVYWFFVYFIQSAEVILPPGEYRLTGNDESGTFDYIFTDESGTSIAIVKTN